MAAEQRKIPDQSIRIPLTFEQNRGQAGKPIRFIARSGAGRVLLTRDGAILAGSQEAGHPIHLYFDKGQRAEPIGETPTGGIANYYSGRDQRDWLTAIPMFSHVRYPNVYPGIDAVFHGNGDQLEYDFEVSAGADPELIAFRFDGANQIHRTDAGALEIQDFGQSWQLLPPMAYQMRDGVRHTVSVEYRMAREHRIGLRLGSYDHSAPLVIDPVVQYAGIITMNNRTGVTGIRVDSQGDLLIAGETLASDYPVVNGQAGTGLYITKLNPAGDTILFSTFIQPGGGSGLQAVTLDSADNLYLTGQSGGINFPVTTALGTSGGFVIKLAPNGTIAYAALMNGAFPQGLAVDAAGSAYVSGTADTTLQTVNAFQPLPPCAGPTCGALFFAKINPTGTAYVFSSYFYDPAAPQASVPLSLPGIGLDAGGNIYLAGSGSVPHVSSWQLGGGLFVSKFAPDGQTLQFSTDFGTDSTGQGLRGMAVGSDGTVYLVGETFDNGYPYTVDAARHPEGQVGNLRMFATAINPALTGLTYSTYIADGNIGGTFLGPNGHLYIAGDLTGPFQTQNTVVSDVSHSGAGFFVELDALGIFVKASRFGGHLTDEIPSAITADAAGNIYLAGGTSPQNEAPKPDPILVGKSFGVLTGGNFGTFFAKISPTNAPKISLDTSLIPPFYFLRNAGSADLHISSMTFSGGTVFGNCGAVVAAGTSCIVTPADINGGLAPGTLTITSDDTPAVQTFQVTLAPFQKPHTAIGDRLWFDDDRQILPQRFQQTVPFHVWNVGAANAVINLIALNNGIGNTPPNDCGTGLTPGASCTIQLTVTGPGSGVFSIFFDNGGQKTFSLFPLGATDDPLLSVSGIRFPLQFVGGIMLPRSITVTNTGGNDIVVPAPLLTGDPEFTIAGNTCPNPLPSGQSCVIAVQFTPLIDGNRTAVLNVGSSAVQLSAQGEINSAILISPLQQDFFPQVVHLGIFTSPVKLTNTLASAVPITGISFSVPDYSETDDCAGQVPANGFCTVQVAFSPQAVGQRNGTMTVNFTGATAQEMTLTGSGETPFLVTPTTLNFSAGVGGTSTEHFVSIGNRSSSTLGYTFTVTGDFAIAQNPCANPLPPNGAPFSGCGPTLVFKPTVAGPAQGSFTVSYSGITETDVVALNGIASTVNALPLQLSFPTTTIGQSSSLDVTLSNSGASAVGITSITSSSGSYSESDSCAGQVPANGTCLLHVKFTPNSVTFPVIATLTVNLADGAQYVVGLTGIGTGPVIAITGTPVNFPAQVVGTTTGGPITLFVINNGDAPLLISGISITGDFTQTNNCPASLVSTCSINVTFSPKATGLRSGILSITDNGLNSPQQISVTGTGTDFDFAPGGTTQVTVVAGDTATFNLSAMAVNGFSGQLSFDCAGAPAGALCSLSTPNLNVIGNVPVPLTVTVTTSPHTSASSRPQKNFWGFTLASIIACVPLAFFARKQRARVWLTGSLAVLVVAIVLAGCGGGGGTPPNPTPTPPSPTPTPPLTTGGTPAGTYTMTVTATAQTGSGPVSHQVQMTLVVH
ncbi:MAG: choice-of-anchor D domain-containing protein [Acidobacteriia bacterium]|nr:choice-of-anchor D domain-containing protein [Terriglobia bacterium]